MVDQLKELVQGLGWTNPCPLMAPPRCWGSLGVNRWWLGDGSIPIDTFLVGWTSIYQLFWGSPGTRVLTHPQQMMIWCFQKQRKTMQALVLRRLPRQRRQGVIRRSQGLLNGCVLNSRGLRFIQQPQEIMVGCLIWMMGWYSHSVVDG